MPGGCVRHGRRRVRPGVHAMTVGAATTPTAAAMPARRMPTRMPSASARRRARVVAPTRVRMDCVRGFAPGVAPSRLAGIATGVARRHRRQMKKNARIRLDGGLFMLPCQTPYELETVLDSLAWYASRQGKVQLELDGHHWSVEHGVDAENNLCAGCHSARATLTFVNGARLAVCPPCARATLSSPPPRVPRPQGSRSSAASA